MASIEHRTESQTNIIEISDSEVDNITERPLQNTVYVVKKLPEVINIEPISNIARSCLQTDRTDDTPSDDGDTDNSRLHQLSGNLPGLRPTLQPIGISSKIYIDTNPKKRSRRSLIDLPAPQIIYQFDRPKYKQNIASRPNHPNDSFHINYDSLCGEHDGRLISHKMQEQKRRQDMAENFQLLNDLLFPTNSNSQPQAVLLDGACERIEMINREEEELTAQLNLHTHHRDELQRRLKLLSAGDHTEAVEESALTCMPSSDGSSSSTNSAHPKNGSLFTLQSQPRKRLANTSGALPEPKASSLDRSLLISPVPRSNKSPLPLGVSAPLGSLCDKESPNSGSTSLDMSVPDSESPVSKESLLDRMFKDASSHQMVNSLKEPVAKSSPSPSPPKCSLLSAMFKDAMSNVDSSLPQIGSKVEVSPSSSPQPKTSLLGKMSKDVEGLLQKNIPTAPKENKVAVKSKTVIIDSSNPPQKVLCGTIPSGLACSKTVNGLVLAKCTHCKKKIAFSNTVPGLVVCPKCSKVFLQFHKDENAVKTTQTKNVVSKHPHIHSKLKKSMKVSKKVIKRPVDDEASGSDPDIVLDVPYVTRTLRQRPPPKEVINIDSESEGETPPSETGEKLAPSKVTPRDVLDVLKDGVKGYVDNVDGDEVIVVLK